jgi:hypothetical protein
VRQSLKFRGHLDSFCERFLPHDFGDGIVHNFNLPGIQSPLHARPSWFEQVSTNLYVTTNWVRFFKSPDGGCVGPVPSCDSSFTGAWSRTDAASVATNWVRFFKSPLPQYLIAVRHLASTLALHSRSDTIPEEF